MNRREFVGNLGTGAAGIALGGTSLVLSGCNPVQDIENWTPVAIAALTNIQNILLANGIAFNPTITLALTALKAALADLLGACQEYLATTPPPAGTLQKVKTFVQDVIDNFGTFLSSLNLPGGSLLNLIVGLIQVVLATVTGLVNELPATPSGFKTYIASSTFRSGNVAVAIVPAKNPTVRTFKNAYNHALDAASDGLTIPASAHMHVTLRDRLHL